MRNQLFASLLLLFGPEWAAAQKPLPEQAAWQHALHAPVVQQAQARAVVLDVESGKLLAAVRLQEAAHALATPGSTLKPLLLYSAIDSGRWNPARRVACARRLHLGTHTLNCTHPLAEAMDAQEALAWSCNTYFATLAGALTPEELRQALAVRGLLAPTGLVDSEAAAVFRRPRNAEEVRLTALGVDGVRVTLLELASAYRHLELEMEQRPSEATRVVTAGLRDSASFGMAGAAALGGVAVAGKTGTAEALPGASTHGWFVGLAPAEHPRVVIAVYVPAGNGAMAAAVAASLLAGSPLRSR